MLRRITRAGLNDLSERGRWSDLSFPCAHGCPASSWAALAASRTKILRLLSARVGQQQYRLAIHQHVSRIDDSHKVLPPRRGRDEVQQSAGRVEEEVFVQMIPLLLEKEGHVQDVHLHQFTEEMRPQ